MVKDKSKLCAIILMLIFIVLFVTGCANKKIEVPEELCYRSNVHPQMLICKVV
tara:strand:- start:167 stop:325 length:159 start_codon:yes stop_codon:yes gene_type:complete